MALNPKNSHKDKTSRKKSIVKKVHFSLPWDALLQFLSLKWVQVVSLTIIGMGKRLSRVMKAAKIINRFQIQQAGSKITNSELLGLANPKNDFSLGCLLSHSKS